MGNGWVGDCFRDGRCERLEEIVFIGFGVLSDYGIVGILDLVGRLGRGWRSG